MAVRLFRILILMSVLVCFAEDHRSQRSTTDLDYFRGVWTITLKNFPETSIQWTVRSEAHDSWMSGTVETNGRRSSTDHWRITRGKIERYAFTTDGLFVSVKSDGWRSGKMVFTGTASGSDGEFDVRESITKVSESKFLAVWERRTADGKWSVFSDETCTKQ